MAPARAAAQVGNIMAEYPLDPQLAKMVVASPEFRWLQSAGYLAQQRRPSPPARPHSCNCYG